MAEFNTVPNNLHYGTVNYPNVSAFKFNITNGPDLSAVVTSLEVGSDFFVINPSEKAAIVSTVLAPSTVLSATLSSYWNDSYFDGAIATTINISVSSQTGSVSAFTIPVTGTFNGLEYPSNNLEVSGFSYDSPQQHARLYVTGII